jgi:general secretion pathway protein I
MPRPETGAENGSSAQGFTLLEVVVALMIFALSFGVLAQIFQTGFRQSAQAEAVATATLVARSELARIGVELPLEIGETEAETDDGFRVRTTILPAEIDVGDDELAPFLVEVTVAWGPTERKQQVELTTLRLGTTHPVDER